MSAPVYLSRTRLWDCVIKAWVYVEGPIADHEWAPSGRFSRTED